MVRKVLTVNRDMFLGTNIPTIEYVYYNVALHNLHSIK